MKIYKIYKLFLVISLNVFLFSCGSKEEKPKKNIPKVKIVQPKTASITKDIIASGTVGSESQVVLSFKTGGLVGKVNINKGDYVHKGDVLAQLNTTELDAQLQQTQEKITKLKRDVTRSEILVKDTIVTLEQLQDQQTELEVAQQEKRTILFNKSQAILKAPKTGFIIDQQLAEGEYKNPGSPVITIGSQGDQRTENWIFTAGLPDKDRVLIREEQKVNIQLDVFPDTKFQGKIIELSAVPNTQTGTYEATIAFQAKQKQLVYGLTGDLLISINQDKKHSVLPVEALVSMEDNNRATIYIVDSSNKVILKTVHILKIMDHQIALQEVLPEEMKVILKGKLQAKPGKTVEITK